MIHIVLYQPEIPQNTGNIIRTAMATGSVLHLIKPYGFVFNEKHLLRASMDYIDMASIRQHVDYQDFLKELKEDDVIYYLTRYGSKDPRQFDFTEVKGDIYLKEARSLNLSNTVAIMVYEVLGQLGYPGLCATETQKGADFLESHEFSETE